MEKNELHAMATAPDFESWATGRHSLPQTVSVCEEELLALRTAIRWLPRLDTPAADSRPEQAGPPHHRPVDAPRTTGEVAPVLLFSPGVRPVVLGRPKAKLTLAQFRVVKALVAVGDAGLCKARLQEVSGDAVNVLKRLARSDDDWGAVIHLPGSCGRGYRIAPPVSLDESTPIYTVPSTHSPTTPH